MTISRDEQRRKREISNLFRARSMMTFCIFNDLSIAVPVDGMMKPQVLNLRTGELHVLQPGSCIDGGMRL